MTNNDNQYTNFISIDPPRLTSQEMDNIYLSMFVYFLITFTCRICHQFMSVSLSIIIWGQAYKPHFTITVEVKWMGQEQP